MKTLLPLLALVLLGGCPWRVEVPGPDACPSYPTCGICASQPECEWLPLPDSRRACYARDRGPDDARGVRTTEGCPEDGPLGTLPPASSGE